MYDYLRHAEAEMRQVRDNKHTHAIASAREARDLYARVRERMFLGLIWDTIRGKQRDLRVLSDEVIRRRGQRTLGVQLIPVKKIIGTENRVTDFDALFRPVQSHTRLRWLSVATAMIHGLAIPPIEVVQVEDGYYVRDGHHRVSVARALGQVDIEAVVTLWEMAVQPAVETVVGATCATV